MTIWFVKGQSCSMLCELLPCDTVIDCQMTELQYVVWAASMRQCYRWSNDRAAVCCVSCFNETMLSMVRWQSCSMLCELLQWDNVIDGQMTELQCVVSCFNETMLLMVKWQSCSVLCKSCWSTIMLWMVKWQSCSILLQCDDVLKGQRTELLFCTEMITVHVSTDSSLSLYVCNFVSLPALIFVSFPLEHNHNPCSWVGHMTCLFYNTHRHFLPTLVQPS